MKAKTRKEGINCEIDTGQGDRIAKRVFVGAALVAMAVAAYGCRQVATAKQPELPKESYDRPPEQFFTPTDYVFKPDQMSSFYDVPGEFGHAMEGADYGFESLSFIITETQPGGGPPLHTHDTEEAHVLLEGKVTYLLGNQKFTVEGPYVIKVPAGVPHTFVNAGNQSFHLIGILPANHIHYKELGPNPLIKEQ